MILVAGAAVRLAWWDSATGPFYASQTTVLWIDKLFRTGTFGQAWLDTLHRFQVNWTHESAVVLPVAAGFQRLLGPSFHLPLVIGAF